VKARLLSKDSESRYTVTPLGKLTLSLLPSFELIQSERDFFLSHDISSLPAPFIHRLGELTEHRTINHLDEALAHSEEAIRGAKNYVWLMADQPIRQSFPHEHPAGVEFRLIFPKDTDSEAIQRIRSRIGGGLQVARIESVKVTVVMNEKTAAVYFPSLDGRMDLSRGFAGENPEFHRWVEDLYSFYWGRGRAGYPD
jgi:predicted transcriptional regulator